MVVVVHHQRAATAQVGAGQQVAFGQRADAQPHGEPEGAARAVNTADADLATHQAGEVFGNHQAQSGAAKLAGG